MRILIVGGEGFIGQALVARLLKGASRMTVLDQRVALRLEDARLHYVDADISDRDALERSNGVDRVFHLASIPCAREPSSYLRQIYFDTIVYRAERLRHLIAEVGASQVVVGTDCPFDMAHYDMHGLLDAVPGLSESGRAAILGGNAARLMNLPSRTAG